MRGLIVAGIGTEVGKTIASAVLVEGLKADYWKPVQAGDLSNTDSHKIRALVSNKETVIHPEAFRLSKPMSPHAAAEIDEVQIRANGFKLPKTKGPLIVELAGGVMVPFNSENTNLDLIKEWKFPVILVVNFYLGSINHTLLTIKILHQEGCLIKGLLFIGEVNEKSKQIILKMSGCKNLGVIPYAKKLNKAFIIDAGKTLKML